MSDHGPTDHQPPPVRIVTAPTIRLVGRQAIDDAALAGFLADNGAAGWATDAEAPGERLAEVAGRLCYMSFSKPRPGGNAAYLGHILGAGHGSVLEHAVFNLIIEGVSRSFTHELVRHRVGWGYSQLSQRYVDESDVAFVVPPLVLRLAAGGADWPLRRWARYAEECRDIYVEMVGDLNDLLTVEAWHAAGSPASEPADMEWEDIDHALAWVRNHPDRDRKTSIRKAAREAARSVLPNCTETKIFVTANARALRHFIEMRGAAGADAEMQRVAAALLAILQVESPALFGDYRADADGIATDHRKV